jgi:tRNA-dihydrouridine synthase B
MTTNFWKEKITFKNLKIPRLMSAPIDGYLDSPLRQLMRIYSKEELLWGQMRHVASISNAKHVDEFNINKTEHPFCFQVSANKTDFVEKAVEKVLKQNFAMVNLNSGCPAKKIINSGTGSALMKDLPTLKKIIKIITKTVNNKIPFTIKIRAGFKEKNGLEVALMAQDLGVDGIIIHPRLQSQCFSGDLDFDLVKKIKESVKIPVIFSGDIIDTQTAKKTYELTGVDGLMIGRALYGAPWKIKEIEAGLLNENFEITEQEKIKTAIKHLEFGSKFYGQNSGFNMLKKHIPMYIKNIDAAATIRRNLVRAQNENEMKEILEDLLDKLN